MTVLSAPWYTSSTFWVGAAGVVVAIAGTVVAAMRGTPYRRPSLIYSMTSVARMISAPDGIRSGLEVRHLGALVRDPYVVKVRLVASGPRDIPSTAFDSDNPLRLDVQVPIVDILEIDLTPETVPAPKLKVNGTAVEVPPCRIDRRQQLTITLVVDGRPKLKCESPLNDVNVRPGIAITPGTIDKSTQAGGNVVLMMALLAAILTGGDVPSWVIIAMMAIGLIVGVIIYIRGRREMTTAGP